MGTTSLFVELVIIGVGAAAWVSLFLLAAFGTDWVPVEKLFAPSATVPVVAVIYLLGIVADRLADSVLGPLWAKGNRRRVYGDERDLYAVDKMLVLSEPAFAKLFEYNKSRQRICRGWTFNAIAALVALHAFVWLQHGLTGMTVRVLGLGSVVMVLVAGGCWFSGRRLNLVQYEKVKEQAALIRARQTAPSLTSR